MIRAPGEHGAACVWYAVDVKSPVSIALFFLLSAFFLFALLGVLQHSGKLLAIALGCLAGVVCIIVFLTPVRLPNWWPRKDNTTTTVVGAVAGTTTTTILAAAQTTTSAPPGTTTTTGVAR
jgi:hypothetical protein